MPHWALSKAGRYRYNHAVKKSHPLQLKAPDLRYVCDPKSLGFQTTEEVEPLDQVIGQDRAVRSIDFGLSIRSFGYNIYAAGVPGTGKKSLIKSFVDRIARNQPVPPDIFYVHNFAEPDFPYALKARPGVGAQLKKDMDDFIGTLRLELPKAFQSEDYEKRKARIVEDFQRERQTSIEMVQSEARKSDMVIKGTDTQVMTVPLVNGQEVSPEAFEQLPAKVQEDIRRRQKNLSVSITNAYREIRNLQQAAQDKIRDLDRRVALSVEGHLLTELRTKYKGNKGILDYLKAVEEDILQHLAEFLQAEGEAAADPLKAAATAVKSDLRGADRYRVNVLVDNSRLAGAPVVVESNPTYKNLIGTLEREARMGTLYTDFSMIRAGSVLHASGGYLILDMTDLLMSPFAWEALKRVVQNKEVKIEDVTEQYGFMATVGLRPQPVEVDLKVIVSGSSDLYHLLYVGDEDFQKIFKIKADFDVITPNSPGQIQMYARYISRTCREEGLKHFDRQAVAALIEHSARMVSDKRRLTLRFSDVADLIRESSYWASQNGNRLVRKQDVEKAIQERVYRSSLQEEHIQDLINDNSIRIETSGEVIGQINGLSVYQTGSYAFGKPTRITARVSIGDQGVVNIEREAKLSGSIHDKGVLILSGYLHGRYGQKFSLALNASVCFEQSYGGVDGDSASSTELYAVLSSLSGVPLKQSIAVTGSVDQMGMIQPIGGVNEKIEGFFETCRAAGLTGDQGVMIPRQNVPNLMLKQDVIDAAKKGSFHIYAISTIDEGLQILTGRKAGAQKPDGTYPSDSIHFLVQKRLEEMVEERMKDEARRRLRMKKGKG
ncbi:MAG: ATP-binding protein [Acidobacteria bacterium]|nr:MAG: ATP-binding protein [Acidobacteriota bacterium]